MNLRHCEMSIPSMAARYRAPDARSKRGMTDSNLCWRDIYPHVLHIILFSIISLYFYILS